MHPNISPLMSVSKDDDRTDARPVLLITPTERQALQLIAEGATTARMCEILGLAASAIDPYLTALFSKFGVASRAEAIAAAIRRGLLTSY